MKHTSVFENHKSRMARNKWLHAQCAVAVAIVTGTAMAQSTLPARSPVTPIQVIAAMETEHIPTTDVRVDLAAPMTASVANAQLEILGFAAQGAHRAQMRLGCKNRAECIPFYAVAEWPATVASALLEASWKDTRNLSATQWQAGRDRVGTILPTLHPGSHVTLLLDGGKVHVRVSAVCLEKGAVGETIRVATPDRKQTFSAEIVSDSTLKGSL